MSPDRQNESSYNALSVGGRRNYFCRVCTGVVADNTSHCYRTVKFRGDHLLISGRNFPIHRKQRLPNLSTDTEGCDSSDWNMVFANSALNKVSGAPKVIAAADVSSIDDERTQGENRQICNHPFSYVVMGEVLTVDDGFSKEKAKSTAPYPRAASYPCQYPSVKPSLAP